MAVGIGWISKLFVYPIKSCAGLAVKRGTVGDLGLEYDRQWMVVNAVTGKALTQRERGLERMALIRPRISDNMLHITAPDALSLAIGMGFKGKERRTVCIGSHHLCALDEGDAAADWLSSYLGTDCRLVRFLPSVVRSATSRFAPPKTTLAFTDRFPILVVTQKSVGELNKRMPAGQTVSVERFRPNIVIDGWEPHAEDSVKGFSLAGVGDFLATNPCSRCRMVNVNPATGEVGPDVLSVLREYRYMQPDNDEPGIHFGHYFVNRHAGSFAIGNSVTPILL